MMMSILIREPHGTFAKVMSVIPFSSGSVIMLRSSMDPGSLGWWEIAAALAVLLISTWVAIRVGARLFRVGLLSAGARPSLREILRQARLA
jgi:ABC-2 type transport system permease protein